MRLPPQTQSRSATTSSSSGLPIKGAGIAHQTLNIKAGGRVKEPIFHIQKANAYDSRLKGWMQRFNRVATGCLDSYLGWRQFFERHQEVATNQKSWLIEPRNGSWAQKSRVRYWCAW